MKMIIKNSFWEIAFFLGTITFLIFIDYHEIFSQPIERWKKQSAVFNVPDTKYKVSIERVTIHQTLAEYKRSIVILKNNQQIKKIDMFTDTGGYSRADLFKIENFKYYIKDKLGDYYILDFLNENFKKDFIDSLRIENSELIGSFDTDKNSKWRFIYAQNKGR